MMTEDHWLAVMARITPMRPVDLDRWIFDETAPAMPAWKAGSGSNDRVVSAALWEQPDGEWSTIGVRILIPLSDPAGLALRLASTALERKIAPVILTTLHNCGLEQFGFRVERLGAPTADGLRRQETEIARFWTLAIIVDATDISG
jgi:hypothetical protein